MIMKKLLKLIPTLMLLTVLTIGFSSCKQTNKNVDFTVLPGEWLVTFDQPNFVMDGSITYIIEQDGTFNLEMYNALNGETYTERSKYELNKNEGIITFVNAMSGNGQAYKIVSLTSEAMQLEKVEKSGDAQDQVTLKKLVREIDANALPGRWVVVFDDPNFVMDGSLSYLFKEDKTFEYTVYNALNGEAKTTKDQYTLDTQKGTLTFTDAKAGTNDTYNIIRLDDQNMQLRKVNKSGSIKDNMKLKKVSM